VNDKQLFDEQVEKILGPEFKTGDMVELSNDASFNDSVLGQYVGKSYGCHFMSGDKKAYRCIKQPETAVIDGVTYWVKTSVKRELKQFPVIPVKNQGE